MRLTTNSTDLSLCSTKLLHFCSWLILDPNDDVTRMTTDTDIDLASLQPFTSYYMSINAASKAGKGPWSGLKEVQTLQGGNVDI